MSTKQILFRFSYILAMVGGLVTVAVAWLIAQPTEGANIGAGLLILAGTGIMGGAVLTCIIAWIVSFTQKSSR